MSKNPLQRKVVQRWPKRKKIAERRYNKFVLPFLPDLRQLANKIAGGNESVVDDMVAEATIKIVANAAKFKKGMPKKLFVLAVARNLMLDMARRERIQNRHFRQQSFESFFSIIDSKQKNPWETLSGLKREQIVKVVENLLDSVEIAPEAREMFEFYTGIKDKRVKSYKETAERFGIPMGTVKSRLNLLRRRMRKQLAGPKR